MALQIFLDYSDDDFETSRGPLRITNNIFENESPNIWETFDGNLNLLWKISGTVDGIDNPIVYLKEYNGLFNEDNKVIVKDFEGNDIKDIDNHNVKRLPESEDIVLVYWFENTIFLRKG